MKPNRTQPSLRLSIGVLSVVLTQGLAHSQAALIPPRTAFVNQNPIIIPSNGPANPFPSGITVAGVSGEILEVTVTVQNLIHPFPDDLDILLMGPSGERVLLLSDAGGDNFADGLVLTFSDGARLVPPDSGRLFSGAYRPANYAPNETFPAPAPPPPYGASLSVFDGTNPNGVWRLYVLDDQAPFNGIIAGGWRLDIATTNYPPEIVRQPEDQTVPAGATARFTVSVKGTPPLRYQWYHNGQIRVPFSQGTDTLTLPEVKASDAGQYAVLVENAVGATESRKAFLEVVGPLDVVIEPPSAIVQPGASVTFLANVAGFPPLRYQWTLNGAVLPGQTNSSLSFRGVEVGDGGHYAVMVWNGSEARRSPPALLTVFAPTGAPPEDKFDARPRFDEVRGVLQDNSSRADTEPGEPVQPGGGRTVWFEWTPPATGVATISTRGSSFDTLLAVYLGNGLADLRLVTRDNDSGPGFTSELKFNTRAGTPYLIQVDGFGVKGTGGPFTVQWNLEREAPPVPVIVVPPESLSVGVGKAAEFRVQTLSPNDSFQWFRNGKELDGETADTLIIREASSRDVGVYHVGIHNAFNQIITSPPFQMQAGTPGLPLVTDKFETMMMISGNAGFIGIGLGNLFFAEVPAEASGGPEDPTPCGGPFFGTLWQGLNATNNGVIQVETSGSQIPARLAVYLLTGGSGDFTNPPVICDLTSASNGVAAIAKFDASSGTNYAIIVEGLGAGNLTLTSKMGIAPPFTSTLQHCAVAPGGGVVLSMPSGATNWCPLPSCQWKFQGTALPNETNATLLVTNFSESMVGTYSVVISNFVSVTTRDVAVLLMAGPFNLSYSWLGAPGSSGFKLVTSNTAPFVLETTTALTGPWTPIATNPDPCLILLHTNFGLGPEPARFFRAAPWSPP